MEYTREAGRVLAAARLEFYRRMRPGEPPSLDNANVLLDNLFYNPRRYDLGRVGRYKLNRRLSLDASPEQRILTQEDLVSVLRELIRVNNGESEADDIDHLGNRRVRAVGELIQNQLRVGFLRMERVIKERMTIVEPEVATPAALVNIRPVVAAIREFFAGSQLSQFMDQPNPLAELTHKRRLSALGPGGLSRDGRASTCGTSTAPTTAASVPSRRRRGRTSAFWGPWPPTRASTSSASWRRRTGACTGSCPTGTRTWWGGRSPPT